MPQLPTLPSPPTQFPKPLAQPLQNVVEKIESHPPQQQQPIQQFFKHQQPFNQQQQRPISTHAFNSSTQPLSPLPLLQTSSSPQNVQYYTTNPNPHSNVAAGSGSFNARRWAHVDSPRSPGGSTVVMQPPYFTVPPPFGVDTVDQTANKLEQSQQVRDVDTILFENIVEPKFIS